MLVRLPHELKGLFREWLDTHLPERAEHVLSLIRQSRGGVEYDATFGKRMRGEGVFADLIARRFKLAHQRMGYDGGRERTLDCRQFVAPHRDVPVAQAKGAQGRPSRPSSPQGELF